MSIESSIPTDLHIKLLFALKQLDEHQRRVEAQDQQQAELVQQFCKHNEHLAGLTSLLDTRLNQGLQEALSHVTQTAIESFKNKMQTLFNDPLQHLQETITSCKSLQEHTERKAQWHLGLIVIACVMSMLFASGMTLFFNHYQQQAAKQNLNYLRYGLALKQAWPHLSKQERTKILGEGSTSKKEL